MKKNHIIALTLFVVIAVWMASGILKKEPEATEDSAEDKRPAMLQVRAIDSVAEEIVLEVVANGKTAPNRTVTIRSELKAKVINVAKERGEEVDKGDLLVELDPKDQQFLLRRSKALFDQRTLEYKAAERLQEKKLISNTNVASAKAELEQARAGLELLTLNLENTQVIAPFEGILQSRPVELGHFLKEGDEIAMIVDNDPLIVIAEVTEKDIYKLKNGMPARAKLKSGKIIEGRIRYIAAVSDEQTRTFTVEIEVDNPGYQYAAGETAQVFIAAGKILAHKIPPSHLTLNDEGALGLKIVNEENIIEFVPVDIAKSTSEGMWLKGLPEKARVVTIGSGFANIGEEVIVDLITKD